MATNPFSPSASHGGEIHENFPDFRETMRVVEDEVDLDDPSSVAEYSSDTVHPSHEDEDSLLYSHDGSGPGSDGALVNVDWSIGTLAVMNGSVDFAVTEEQMHYQDAWQAHALDHPTPSPAARDALARLDLHTPATVIRATARTRALAMPIDVQSDEKERHNNVTSGWVAHASPATNALQPQRLMFSPVPARGQSLSGGGGNVYTQNMSPQTNAGYGVTNGVVLGRLQGESGERPPLPPPTPLRTPARTPMRGTGPRPSHNHTRSPAVGRAAPPSPTVNAYGASPSRSPSPPDGLNVWVSTPSPSPKQHRAVPLSTTPSPPVALVPAVHVLPASPARSALGHVSGMAEQDDRYGRVSVSAHHSSRSLRMSTNSSPQPSLSSPLATSQASPWMPSRGRATDVNSLLMSSPSAHGMPSREILASPPAPVIHSTPVRPHKSFSAAVETPSPPRGLAGTNGVVSPSSGVMVLPRTPVPSENTRDAPRGSIGGIAGGLHSSSCTRPPPSPSPSSPPSPPLLSMSVAGNDSPVATPASGAIPQSVSLLLCTPQHTVGTHSPSLPEIDPRLDDNSQQRQHQPQHHPHRQHGDISLASPPSQLQIVSSTYGADDHRALESPLAVMSTPLPPAASSVPLGNTTSSVPSVDAATALAAVRNVPHSRRRLDLCNSSHAGVTSASASKPATRTASTQTDSASLPRSRGDFDGYASAWSSPERNTPCKLASELQKQLLDSFDEESARVPRQRHGGAAHASNAPTNIDDDVASRDRPDKKSWVGGTYRFARSLDDTSRVQADGDDDVPRFGHSHSTDGKSSLATTRVSFLDILPKRATPQRSADDVSEHDSKNSTPLRPTFTSFACENPWRRVFSGGSTALNAFVSPLATRMGARPLRGQVSMEHELLPRSAYSVRLHAHQMRRRRATVSVYDYLSTHTSVGMTGSGASSALLTSI